MSYLEYLIFNTVNIYLIKIVAEKNLIFIFNYILYNIRSLYFVKFHDIYEEKIKYFIDLF
jgi:hypothetical protein